MKEIKILDLKNTGIVPLNKLETFILVEGTKHYYISSEGRLINDIRGKFYIHKDTLLKGTNRVHWKIQYEDKTGVGYKKDVKAEYLVAHAFLEPVKGKNKIYHIDGNNSNSKYNNLIYVSDLEAHNMYTRCYNTKLHKRFPEYIGCTICDYWLEDKERFYKWVEENYYMISNEQIDLDKDILFKGNKVYSPETCVFVPHTINTLLLNCKRKRGKYPLGVNYEKAKGKYRAALHVDGKTVKLGHFDTAEEAVNYPLSKANGLPASQTS